MYMPKRNSRRFDMASGISITLGVGNSSVKMIEEYGLGSPEYQRKNYTVPYSKVSPSERTILIHLLTGLSRDITNDEVRKMVSVIKNIILAQKAQKVSN